MNKKLLSSMLMKFISAIMLGVISVSSLSLATAHAAADYLEEIILGESNILAAEDSGSANFLIAQQAVSSQDGTIQSLSYYVSSPGGQLRLGIYTNANGNPGTLVAQTDVFTPGAGWNTQNVLTPAFLPAGTYWLAHIADNASLKSRYEFSGTARGYSLAFSAMPEVFATPQQTAGMHYSFYATLTTGSTATFTPTIVPSSTSTAVNTPVVTSTFTSAPPSPTNTVIPTNTTVASTITLGETNVLNTNDSNRANFLIAQQAVLPQSGTIQSLSVYVAGASGQVRLGIYSNSANNPGTLLAQTGAFTPTTGWNTQNVLTPTNLPAGTYWLGFVAQSNSLQLRYELTGTARGYSYTFGTLPTNFSTSPATAGLHYSLYATLTTGTTATFTPTSIPPSTSTATNTPSPIPTNTPIPSTATSTAIFTSTSTSAVPGATFTPTNTPVPPSATFTVTTTQVPSNTPTATVTNTPVSPLCSDPLTCSPVSAIPSRWVCNIPGCTSPDWVGSVISWPSWSAYSTNARSGDQSRTVYSNDGQVLYPYMGSWADGCQVSVVSGTVVIIEWRRGANVWRETYLNPGDNYTIDLISPEDGALIEGSPAGFSVNISNCSPVNIYPSPTPTNTSNPNVFTIGETNVLGTNDSNRANFLIAQQAVLPQSGTIQSLSVYVAGASGQVRLGIYSSSANNPGTLLAQTGAFTPTTGWNTQNVLTPTNLPAGTYWLGFVAQSNSLQLRYELTGTARGYSYTFGTLPTNFSTSPATAGLHYSLYATLTN